MKKYIITICIAVVSLLLSKNAMASFDIFKDFIEIIGLSEEDVSVAVDEYIKYEVELQEKTTDTANQKMAKKLARNAIKAANTQRENRNFLDIMDYTEFYNTKVSNFQWPGLDAATDAAEYTTPQTKKQTALSFFKQRHVRDDVVVNMAKDAAINNLAIENLAIDYANGLSARYNLQEEMKKLSNEENFTDSGKDIQQLETNYGVIMRRANHRWLDVLRFEASHIVNMLVEQANNVRLDDVSEVIGEDVSAAAQHLREQGVRTPEHGSSGGDWTRAGNTGSSGGLNDLTVGDIARNVSSGIEALKNKNYSSAFDSMSSLYGGASSNPKVAETLSKISGKVATGQNVYNNASNENYEGAASTVYDEGKGYYDQYKADKKAKSDNNGATGGNDNDANK